MNLQVLITVLIAALAIYILVKNIKKSVKEGCNCSGCSGNCSHCSGVDNKNNHK